MCCVTIWGGRGDGDEAHNKPSPRRLRVQPRNVGQALEDDSCALGSCRVTVSSKRPLRVLDSSAHTHLAFLPFGGLS
ncbi:unnamed protein product [Boreogadus saida]